jgi:hypothetical protein
MAGIEDLIRVYRGTENIPADEYKPLRYPDAGKYFTTDIDTAKNYATRANTLSGKVNYLDLTKEQFEKAKNLSKSRSVRLPGEVIVDDDLLKKQKIDILKTIMARAENLTPLAMKGLNILSSLPVATLTLVLQSTPANADEANMKLEDFARLAGEEKEGIEAIEIGDM